MLRHSVAILLACAAGVLTLAPQLIVEHTLGAAYQGIHKEMNDDEGYYVARAQEVLDGHPTIGNAYLHEEKTEPPLQVWMPEAILAWTGHFFFHDTRTTWLAWDLLFPPLIFLLTYAIALLLTRSRLLGLGTAVLLSIGIFLEIFNRSPSPQVNFVFFLAFLYALFSLVQARSRRALIAATALLGALFYIYTYYWTYVVILLGLVGLGALVLFRDRGLTRDMAIVTIGGGILGIPYFLGLRAAESLPYYAESLARVGLIITHSPSGIFIVGIAGFVVIAYLVGWWFKRLPFTPLSYTLFAGVLAGAIATNQHLVTGLNLEFSSHYYLVSMYADAFALLYAIATLSEAVPRYALSMQRALLFLALVIAVANAAHVVRAQLTLTPRFVAEQRYAPALLWLQAHTKTDDVVYADDTLSFLIPQYTHDDVFYAPAAELYIMPQQDIRARFLIQHYFGAAFTVADFKNGNALERMVYGNYYIEIAAHRASLNTLRRLIGLSPLPIERYPENDLEALVAEECAFRTLPFEKAIGQYRVDYIVWDRVQHADWHVDRLAGFSPVARVGDFTIFARATGS